MTEDDFNDSVYESPGFRGCYRVRLIDSVSGIHTTYIQAAVTMYEAVDGAKMMWKRTADMYSAERLTDTVRIMGVNQKYFTEILQNKKPYEAHVKIPVIDYSVANWLDANCRGKYRLIVIMGATGFDGNWEDYILFTLASDALLWKMFWE